jgi:hypothetical protein
MFPPSCNYRDFDPPAAFFGPGFNPSPRDHFPGMIIEFKHSGGVRDNGLALAGDMWLSAMQSSCRFPAKAGSWVLHAGEASKGF